MYQYPLGLLVPQSQETLQLLRTIRDLEERLAKFEKQLTVSEDSVTLNVGNSSLTMKKDGTIILSGKDISLTAFGKISVKASSDLVLKGSKILEN